MPVRRSVLLGLLTLGACATQSPQAELGAALPLPGDISCVPFARALSGISLAGDAHLWWAAAEGRYPRSARPAPGSVLVIARSRAVPRGHLAVVVALVGPREILVTHANWASGTARGRVAENQRVVDVSQGNDWSSVRVWYPPTQSLGVTVHRASGFIHPGRAVDPARLAARVPQAAEASAGTL
jgi:hypothetical protein